MSVSILKVQNPGVFEIPVMRDFFHAAFPEGTVFAPDGFEAIEAPLKAILQDEAVDLLIGVDELVPKALALIYYPDGGLMSTPQVAHFFNQGSVLLRNTLVSDIVRRIKERGFSRFHAVNGSGRPDAAWARLFSLAGPAKRVGSVMEFEV